MRFGLLYQSYIRALSNGTPLLCKSNYIYSVCTFTLYLAGSHIFLFSFGNHVIHFFFKLFFFVIKYLYYTIVIIRSIYCYYLFKNTIFILFFIKSK